MTPLPPFSPVNCSELLPDQGSVQVSASVFSLFQSSLHGKALEDAQINTPSGSPSFGGSYVFRKGRGQSPPTCRRRPPFKAGCEKLGEGRAVRFLMSFITGPGLSVRAAVRPSSGACDGALRRTRPGGRGASAGSRPPRPSSRPREARSPSAGLPCPEGGASLTVHLPGAAP